LPLRRDRIAAALLLRRSKAVVDGDIDWIQVRHTGVLGISFRVDLLSGSFLSDDLDIVVV